MNVVLNENQVNMIKSHINEQESQKYRVVIPVNVYAPRVTYKGQEINDIDTDKITLTFDIDLEIRNWGIKTANIYGITGPEEIPFNVYPYEGDGETETISIPVDWSNIKIEKSESSGPITITDPLEIELMNDEAGNIVIKSINVFVNSF